MTQPFTKPNDDKATFSVSLGDQPARRGGAAIVGLWQAAATPSRGLWDALNVALSSFGLVITPDRMYMIKSGVLG